MAIAYKSAGAGASSESSGAAVSPASPATVDANDILIIHAYFEGTTTAPDTPAGFTLLSGPHTIESTIGRHWIYGKIAAGTEDGAANALGTQAVTTMRSGRCYSFSGYVSGTITALVRGFSATSHATDPQMPSVTTTQAGALAVACVAQNDNNTAGSATGESGGDWTEAVAEYVAALTPGLMLQLQTCTPTSNPGTVSGGSVATTNDPCGVIGFEIRDSPQTFTLTASGTTYSLNGQAASLEYNRLLVAAAAAYVLTGQDAGLLRKYPMTASGTTYAWTGQDATLTYTQNGYTLVAGAGSFSLTGQAAGLYYGHEVTADGGAYAWSGQDSGLRYNRLLSASAGVFVWTGVDVTLGYGVPNQDPPLVSYRIGPLRRARFGVRMGRR